MRSPISEGHTGDAWIPRVLVVDDDQQYRDLVKGVLLKIPFPCEVAADAFDALEKLREEDFDLVISDIRMKGKDGLELMLDAQKEYPRLDFILMTGHAPAYSYSDMIGAGAADFITKPFEIGELKAKLDRIVRERRILRRLQDTLISTIDVLASALEIRDPYTAGHQRRVSEFACAIAKEMQLPDSVVDAIRMAGLVHDIGKIAVPSEILAKPYKLKDTEMSLIREHAQVGYEILKRVAFPWPIAQIVHQHHERMDGSGYPQSLAGEDILREARIMAVADVVEAMSSHRPYRAALGIDTALREIARNEGGRYDCEVVDACLRLFQEKGYRLD